jgi:predicted DsbA family dithiol-disulfide isomerase
VEYKPFRVDPSTALDGEELDAYCQRRWGNSTWLETLPRYNSKEKFANWRYWPNTKAAFEFLQFGKTQGADSMQLAEVLFCATYERGLNVSGADALVHLAQEHYGDWNLQTLRDCLEMESNQKDVAAAMYEGRKKYRISSVPFFVIGTSLSDVTPFAFAGAQPSETLVAVFEELYENMER